MNNFKMNKNKMKMLLLIKIILNQMIKMKIELFKKIIWIFF